MLGRVVDLDAVQHFLERHVLLIYSGENSVLLRLAFALKSGDGLNS